jgi:Chaperone of endosialidase
VLSCVMCSTFNAILNLQEDNEDTQPQPPPRPQVLLHIPTTALFNQIRAALVAMDANNSSLFEALTLDQDQQAGLIALLQQAAANVEAEQLQQGNAIEVLQEVSSNMEVEQLHQNSAIEVLQDGFLPRVHYEEEGLGGAHLVFTPSDGIDASSASLQTYDASGNIGSSMEMQGNLITMSENVRIIGDLLLGDSQNTVQAQLDDLEERILQEVIALASNYTLDAVQQATISALAFLLKPKGYEALPDLPDDEDFPDSNSIPPIRLFPAAKFTDALPDELGNAVERINSKGKITVSADVLPTRTMTVGGDVIFLKKDEDDEFECQYTCRLGSKVAVLNSELQLTNPTAVVCRLGTNALVQADGTVQAAAVVTDKLNGIAPSRLLQRYPPSVDGQLNRRLAVQANRITAVARRATKPVLSKSYDEDIARLHAELAPVRRQAFNKPAVLGRDWTDATVRLHDELSAVKRAVHTVQLPSKDYSSDIADLKSTSNRGLKRAAVLPVKDFSESVKRLRTDLTAAMSNTGGLQSYTASISTSNASTLKVVGTLAVSGLTTLGAGLTVSAGTTALSGTLNVTGKVNLAINSASGLTMGSTTVSNPIEWGINASALALPAVSLAGTRLRLHGSGTTTATNDYALGMASSGMWYNVNLNAKHMFSSAGVQLAEIATAGAIFATPVSVSGASTFTVGTGQTLLGGNLTVNGMSTLAGVNAGATRATTLAVTGSSTFASVNSTNITTNNLTVTSSLTIPTGTVSSTALSAGTLNITGASTLKAVNATDVTATSLTVNGDLTVLGSVNTLNTETISVQDRLITLASNSSGTLLNNAGISIGDDPLSAPSLLYSTTQGWISNVNLRAPALAATTATISNTLIVGGASSLSTVNTGALTAGSLTVANNTVLNTLNVTGTSTLGTVNTGAVTASSLSVTGAITAPSVTTTALSTTGSAAIAGILRMGLPGASTIANYQGGTIYFNGPLGDSSDAYSGIQCKNYTNGTSNPEATELLLWQLNDPYADSGPDRIRLYAGEIRFDTYSTGVGVNAQYTESTRMIIMPTGYVGVGTTNPTATVHITAGVGVNSTIPNLAVTNGVGFGASSLPQIGFGYQGTKTYNHYISTRHTGSAGGNSIDFYTCNGVQNNTINDTVYCCTMQNGRLGVNTFNPTDQFHVTGNSTFGGLIQCRGCRYTQGISGGSYGNAINIFWNGSTVECWVDATKVSNNISDYRVKKDIQSLGDGCLDKILNLRPVTYSLKDNGIFKSSDAIQTGFIAHEVQEIIPDATNGLKDKTDKDGVDELQSLNVMPILSTLVKAVQELTARVRVLEGLVMAQ